MHLNLISFPKSPVAGDFVMFRMIKDSFPAEPAEKYRENKFETK